MYVFLPGIGCIAQINDKVGLKKWKNCNIGLGKTNVLEYPPEKEEVIKDAFRHYHLIKKDIQLTCARRAIEKRMDYE